MKNKKAVIFIHSAPFSKGKIKEEKKQEVLCQAKAKRLGCEIKEVFVETTNAFQINSRPYLQDALKCCGNKGNNISFFIALDKDKISRDPDEFENIKVILNSYGVEVVTIY